MHTVLPILTFGIWSSSSRWCLVVVGVSICVHSSTDSDIRHCSSIHKAYVHKSVAAGWWLVAGSQGTCAFGWCLTNQKASVHKFVAGSWWLVAGSQGTCVFCLSMTSQADFISQANITSHVYTRARLARPCFYVLLHDFTSGLHFTS